MQRTIALLLLLPLFLTACGSNSNTVSDPLSAVISGNWQMTLQPAEPNASPRAQSGFLVQNGNNIGGQLMLTDPPCSGTASVNGNVNGTSVSIGLNPTGISVSLTGTVGPTANAMSGNYTILSTGCTGSESSPDTGTWTANLVSPLSGSFTGSFSIGNNSTTYPVTGTISQGPNTGSLNATLSGSLSITGYCFTSANIAGVVSGTSVVLNLLDDSGNQLGQIYGTSSLDGTSLTGKIDYAGQGPSGVKGCRGAASGSISLNW